MDSLNVVLQSWRRHREEQWRVAVQAQMMMNRAPVLLTPYYRELLALAADLNTQGKYDLAVIVSQMACEVIVEQTLTPLLKTVKVRQVFNVHADETLKLYKKHTHDQIDKAAFWMTYGIHAVRRHEVVHRGRRASAAEGQESRDVATQFVDHVERVRNNLAGISQGLPT
jgi:hypothetical protein